MFRNSDKNLCMKPFKKGAFHVAINNKMPILPVVVSEYDFLDVNKMVFRYVRTQDQKTGHNWKLHSSSDCAYYNTE